MVVCVVWKLFLRVNTIILKGNINTNKTFFKKKRTYSFAYGHVAVMGSHHPIHTVAHSSMINDNDQVKSGFLGWIMVYIQENK